MRYQYFSRFDSKDQQYFQTMCIQQLTSRQLSTRNFKNNAFALFIQLFCNSELQIKENNQKMDSMINFISPYSPLFYSPHPFCIWQPTFQQPLFFLNFNNFFQEPPLTQICQLSPELAKNHCHEGLDLNVKATTREVSSLFVSATYNANGDFQENKQILNKDQPLHSSLVKCQEENKTLLNRSPIHRFIKKNTQSNIVNQIFSFLWSPEKSNIFLLRILREQRKVNFFYRVMRSIKKGCKSQQNRFYLRRMLREKEWQNTFSKLKRGSKRMDTLSVEVTCSSMRRLVLIYFREIHISSIMTSKKMNPELWQLHFNKCKEINAFLFNRGTS